MKELIQSYNPESGFLLETFRVSTKQEIKTVIKKSQNRFKSWSSTCFSERKEALLSLQRILIKNKEELASLITQENGKCIYESRLEVQGAINKIDLTFKSYNEKLESLIEPNSMQNFGLSIKPLGLLCVLGPFNFPVHLPMGHIIPAILSGNCVILKPSEYVMGVTKLLVSYINQVESLKGVVNVIYGGANQAKFLLSFSEINGVLFTGSYTTAQQISKQISNRPEMLFAMECGGNNPLVISSFNDESYTLESILKSAYLTSGQRCTCARRLIVVESKKNRQLIDKLVMQVQKIEPGVYDENKSVNFGPLISSKACSEALDFYNLLIKKGGVPLVKMYQVDSKGFFVSPALVDVSKCINKIPDYECFGPVLQLIYSKDFNHACEIANNTNYGLSASVFTSSKVEFAHFFKTVNAGIINWNKPTNGASSKLPFGGVGKSGNYRPAGYTAIDSCVYPVSSSFNG